MSSSINRAPNNFVKLKEIEKKEDRYDEHVNTLFEENGLYRKRLVKGPDSLMRAVSDTLYFTQNQSQEIQMSLVSFLTQLIASDRLTERLKSFQGNSMILKDFASNPHLPGFEKINLELVSLFFKVRVILYTMNEDHYLTATIFNNNYPNTIELLRTKTNHYDAIYSKLFISKAGICQNIVLDILDKALQGKSRSASNISEEYVNLSYEHSIAEANAKKELNNLDQFRVTRGQHKKSLSDNFNTNFETMQEQQMKFLDAFMSAAPADEFMKNFQMRKDTAESNFSINANFDFIDDQNLEPPVQQAHEFAIKNYPVPSSGLSPRGHPMELNSPMPAFSKAKFSSHQNVLFNENLSLAEIERLEKTVNTATTQGDPKQLGQSPFYRAVSPPGLSPAKFSSQRSFTDAIQTPHSHSDFLSPSPIMARDNMNMQASSPAYPYGTNSPNKRGVAQFVPQSFQGMAPQPMNNQRPYPDGQIQAFAPQGQPQNQNFSLHPQHVNNLYMKRTGNQPNPMSMPMQNEEYHMGSPSMGYDQGMQYDQYDQSPTYDRSPGFEEYDQGMMFGQPGYNNMQREKKKPIILDESNERYFGRLKFFDENKKYGFIVMDDDGSDIFVHYDDLIKAGITKELLRTARMGNLIRLNFGCMAYIGKYNRSRKAIDIQLLM